MPQAVVQSARELVGAVLAGEVKWGWSTLRSRLERGRHPVREVVVDPANEQAKAEAAAERWLANAGCHFDQESEVVAELFDRGPLRGFRTVELEHQVLDRWVELRETVVSGAAA